jgi:hypothetical protein
MAKVQNNIFVRGLSGSLGDQFVVRQDKAGRTIVAAKNKVARQFTATQLAHQDAFRMAIAYAKSSKTHEVYVARAEGTILSPFNVAVADWFNQPEVLAMDLTQWNGVIGETIRVKAQDDTLVAQVHVVIRDQNNSILEEGDAQLSDGLWWEYSTKTNVDMTGNPQVTGQAYDLAGNVAEMTVVK